MKSRFSFLMLLVLALVLAACGSSSSSAASSPKPEVERQQASGGVPAFQTDTRTDAQGAVTVAVTPLDINDSGDTLEFDVAMNTHSVDLGMDVADRSTLTTDSGLTVAAITWDAPGGGHHVSGKLTFPASWEGKSLLEGATQVTLTIRDVDAPERVFVWNVVKQMPS